MAVHEHGYGPRRRIGVAALAVGALFAALILPARAAAAEKHAILVVDGNTGRVLYQSSADAARHPASLAKMMTLYLVFEQIEQGRLTYQTKIKVSANAASTAPSKLDLDEGDEIALLDAVKALITKSANDVAVALAEHIAGSEPKFARLMTQKAAQLGMTASLFKNASGLPDPEQVTTARDVVALALRLQDDFPKHYALFATRTFAYNGDTYSNHNKLLVNYEGTDGLKTGYTNASGFNLVASVRRGQKHVVGAVFGGASAGVRDRTMRTFLNIGLVKASNVKTRLSAPMLVAAKPKPKPAPAPRVADVPTPERVERPPVKPATPASANEPQEQAPAQPIEMARVRSVLVAPRPAAATPASIEAVLERTQPEQSDPLPQWTTASAGGARPVFAPSDRPAMFSGALPSTLEEQAARLAGPGSPGTGQAITTQSLKESPTRPRPPAQGQASAAVAGGFQIQIGAFQSAAEAERRLASVRDLAPSVLRSRAPVTLQVKLGDKVLHRARFAGFDAQAAAGACTELKRLKVDCLVLKAE
jgi:D-alanyl-D-alanine carboxypeptidase